MSTDPPDEPVGDRLVSDPAEAPAAPRPAGPPEAKRRPRPWFSWFWLVPAAAVITAAWLGWRSLAAKGPLVAISFVSAEGLDPDKTRVRYKDVEVGRVESVDLTPDLSHVVVKARMKRSVEDRIGATTRFWIVRPRVSAAGVSGLGTLVSGAYIGMDFQKTAEGDDTREFTGLDQPPAVTADAAGRSFVLTADRLGSLSAGSPVYYHGAQVGEVQGAELGADTGRIEMRLFIRAPYDRLVHPQSYFWNATGFQFSASAEGVRLSTESLQSLLAGGVAFDTPPDALAGGPSASGAGFTLYADERAARQPPDGPKLAYMAAFPGSARGLGEGAPVELRGIRVGRVSKVTLQSDAATGQVRIPVLFELDTSLLGLGDALTRAPDEAARRAIVDPWLDRMVARGLRAKIGSGNIITGQHQIDLDFRPDAGPGIVRRDGPVPELPTTDAGDLDSIMAAAQRVMDKLAALPIEDVVAEVRRIVVRADSIIASPEVMRSVRAFDRALAQVEGITRTTNAEIGPLLTRLEGAAGAAEEATRAAKSTFGTANAVLGGDPRGRRNLAELLGELTGAARSLRLLADYVERHPEALIRGKAAGN